MSTTPDATFTIRPTPRCFGKVFAGPGRICGRPASWQRSNSKGEPVSFFCDRCKSPSDAPIAEDALFRRVTVSLDVMFAAVANVLGLSHQEAVSLINERLSAVGGVVVVQSVTDEIGRWRPEAASERLARGSSRG